MLPEFICGKLLDIVVEAVLKADPDKLRSLSDRLDQRLAGPARGEFQVRVYGIISRLGAEPPAPVSVP